MVLHPAVSGRGKPLATQIAMERDFMVTGETSDAFPSEIRDR